MSHGKKSHRPVLDAILLPFVYPSALVMKRVRKAGVQKLPLCKRALLKMGVFPIRNHFYEPQFDMRSSKRDFSAARILPGVDWNTGKQLELLKKLSYAEELADVPVQKTDRLEFYMNNRKFESGDAEIWYQMIRFHKPQRIFEVGSGNSTLMAIKAIRMNQQEDPDYRCKHVCIEPYKMPWLEETDVTVLRKTVEDVEISFFSELGERDFLFIDSSHVIRPDGDVLFEYLELIPSLHRGVIVHVHDIFSPRNYPEAWLREEVKFWNEQYLLESFLCHNSSWEIIAAINYLRHNHYEELKAVCPFMTPERAPGSFYIQRLL